MRLIAHGAPPAPATRVQIPSNCKYSRPAQPQAPSPKPQGAAPAVDGFVEALEALAERLRKALGVQAAVAATQAEHLHRLCKHARRRGANEAAAARAVHEELLMSYAHWCDHMGLLLLGGGALADAPDNVTHPKVYFKLDAGPTSHANGWQTYLRDVSPVQAAALRSQSGTELLLPLVNPTAAAVNLTIDVTGGALDADVPLKLTTLSDADLKAYNTPSAPARVAPMPSTLRPLSNTSVVVALPPQSFVLAVAALR